MLISLGELKILGEQAFAIGAPVGLESSIAVGIVSSLARTGILANRAQPVIQLDASINFGASYHSPRSQSAISWMECASRICSFAKPGMRSLRLP